MSCFEMCIVPIWPLPNEEGLFADHIQKALMISRTIISSANHLNLWMPTTEEVAIYRPQVWGG